MSRRKPLHPDVGAVAPTKWIGPAYDPLDPDAADPDDDEK
jgi:hypothetical protein